MLGDKRRPQRLAELTGEHVTGVSPRVTQFQALEQLAGPPVLQDPGRAGVDDEDPFVASLVQSLAWPAGVVAVVIVLRKPIGAVLGQGVRRVKAGPVEVEFDQLQAEIREELARSPELADAQVPAQIGSLSLGEELSRLAEVAPETAVMTAYRRIEERLTEILDGDDALPRDWVTGRQLAKIAWERGLISEEARAAIDGLSVLRNLTAHVGGDISADRARDYLALADAVLYALRSKPSRRVIPGRVVTVSGRTR